MQLKTFVKVGNITNLSDARYCAGMGVDVLGFNMNTTDEDAVNATSFKEISGWLAGTKFAGEFTNASVTDIKEKVTALELDFVQVNDFELANELGQDHDVIFAVDISHEHELELLENQLPQLNSGVRYVLLSSENMEFYAQIDALLPVLSGHSDILKGYDLTSSNVLGTLDHTTISGIALSGSHEIRPGFKDYDELADILEVLDTDA